MSKLRQIKDKYNKAGIIKSEYIDSMYEQHALLFEYPEFISDTDIAKIEISDLGVIMTARESGIKMFCSSQDKRIAPIEILNFGNYEKEEMAMMFNLVHDGDVFFDVGANFGWYSLNVAKKYPRSLVQAFEPIEKTFGFLQKNIKINNLDNISANNFGLSNEEKKSVFYYYPEGSGNASAANLSDHDSVERVDCSVKTLDKFVEEKQIKIDFIKCDVEGGELFVFQGGVNAIKANQPIIFTEILRKWSKKFNYHPNEIIHLLSDLGYLCFVCRNFKLVQISSIDEETVETNFYFLHKVKHLNQINKYRADES
jgi:FkbM family methyltransferase